MGVGLAAEGVLGEFSARAWGCVSGRMSGWVGFVGRDEIGNDTGPDHPSPAPQLVAM